MKSIIKWTATFGIAASLIGVLGVAPTLAQDWRHDDDNGHIRRDIRDIRRDEQRLRDLQYRRDREARRHDWRDVRMLDDQIADLRFHIEQDRRDVHHDIRDRNYDSDYGRNYNRSHDNDWHRGDYYRGDYR